MASSGGRRIILRVAAAIAVVMLSTAVFYTLLTQGVGPKVSQSTTQGSESNPVRLVTPEPLEKVPGVTRVQTGPHAGDLECGPKYIPTPLIFNTYQEIGDARLTISIDPDGVRIYVLMALPGDALIVNERLTARVPRASKLFLPNSSPSYFWGWGMGFGPDDRIVLCRRELRT